MKSINRIAALCCAASLAACSSIEMPSMGGMGGVFNRGDVIEVSTKHRPNPNAPLTKYAATIRLGKFTDDRKVRAGTRTIGTGGGNVAGLTTTDITISQDVTSLVAATMRNRLDDAGFTVFEDGAANATFELSAAIKDLTLNVKIRDEILIGIELTLREVASGKVVWSGLVVEKNDRFAGVAGNSRADVAEYLRNSLWTVAGKGTDAISSSLMAARPELFNLTPGTRPVPGVTVYVAPTLSAPASAAAAPGPVYQGTPAAVTAPPSSYTPRATATTGLLVVNTSPGRAKVYVDGVYFGLSPLRVEVDPGVHAVSVKLEGYKMATEKVSVRRGDNTEMELPLER
jgi:hypothetical protein